jgi:Tol biopolymer transport system component
MEGASPAPGAPALGEISFESDRIEDGVTEIYIVNSDGSGLSQLTTTGASRHAWSPDGTRIAFTGKDGQIYVMNADGSSLAALADGDSPAWSPDGDRIAFNSNLDGNHEIYVMNADGSEQINLTNNPADDAFGFFLIGPNPNPWSPDGQRLAFNRTSLDGEQGDPTVYVMNADGSSHTRITDAPALFAGWSPDGEEILLFSGSDEGAAIDVINADGSDLARLVDLPGQNPQGFPVWSPDGERIAFTADRDGNDAVYLMNADGSEVTPLTTGTGATGFEGCDGLFGTAWSPDGEHIAFTSGCDFERAVVMVIKADGSGETRIADAPAFFPAWVPAP